MRTLVAPIACMALISAAPLAASAQDRIEIFDAHLHYNHEPKPFYSLDQVRDVFRRNRIVGIIANSRPNKGTHELMDAKWPELTVVPFIRPYRVRSDIQTWFNDPEIFELVRNEYARGYYRGIGEIHIYGKDAESGWVKKLVDFAVERDLYLHAHCDEEALLILFNTIRRPGSSGRIPGFLSRPRGSPRCSTSTRTPSGVSCLIAAGSRAVTAS